MSEFFDVFDLRNVSTCVKNPENPSSINVILTNKLRNFQNSKVIETGLSDHHKLVITVMKSLVKKRAPVVIKYRDFKKYNASAFHAELYYALRQINHSDIDYGLFEVIFIGILDKEAPLKEKLVRANTGTFINRELSKAFVTRSRLRNKVVTIILFTRNNGIIVSTY